MAEIESGMTLYDFNKAALIGAPSATSAEMESMRNKIKKYLKNNHTNSYYFMMLCKEKADYTIFTGRDHTISYYYELMEEDIKLCLANRELELMALNINDDKVLEIWTRTYAEDVEDREVFLYYLFPYDTAIIEYCEVN